MRHILPANRISHANEWPDRHSPPIKDTRFWPDRAAFGRAIAHPLAASVPIIDLSMNMTAQFTADIRG
jgi:hypothetical protein